MNATKIKKRQHEAVCSICKRKFPLKALLSDLSGKLCVDCVVNVEMSTLEAEIKASKVLDD